MQRYLFDTDVIVQICCSKPLKALMLWGRGASFCFQFWDGKQNIVPNMWKLAFANVSIEGRVNDSDDTYFLFQDQFYEQTKEAAMGSPVSSVVANLYMVFFEHRALISAVNPPRLWRRYVDDTLVILQRDEFLQHINFVDPSIILPQKKQNKMVPCLSWTL